VRPGKEAGSGLGLTISKEIISAHGGTILARSNLGKGSTFTFTIPIYFD
jgi:signal transduction histidine kinase